MLRSLSISLAAVVALRPCYGMATSVLLHSVCGFLLQTSPLPPVARRCLPPQMVSERHNQAYKETIKFFAPYPKGEAPPRQYKPTDWQSYGAQLPAHIVTTNEPAYAIFESTAPILTAEECEVRQARPCELVRRGLTATALVPNHRPSSRRRRRLRRHSWVGGRRRGTLTTRRRIYRFRNYAARGLC